MGEEGTTSIKASTDGPSGRRGDDGLAIIVADCCWFRLRSRLNEEGRSDILLRCDDDTVDLNISPKPTYVISPDLAFRSLNVGALLQRRVDRAGNESSVVENW